MKFSTSKQHRDFFHKNGWIEFEGMISPEQLALINQAIDQVLAERLEMPISKIGSVPGEKLYLQGRDLWRSNAVLQKLATQLNFAQIAAELIEKKPLRLGYDQLLPAFQPTSYYLAPSSVYSQFLEKTASLENVSCLTRVACGLLIALNNDVDPPSAENKEEGDVFPIKEGNAIFFQPGFPFDWSHLSEHTGQRFYLVVYAFANARYQLQPLDPHSHAFKRLGYIINDSLNDRLNPILCR